MAAFDIPADFFPVFPGCLVRSLVFTGFVFTRRALLRFVFVGFVLAGFAFVVALLPPTELFRFEPGTFFSSASFFLAIQKVYTPVPPPRGRIFHP